jgi:hypothetical protein
VVEHSAHSNKSDILDLDLWWCRRGGLQPSSLGSNPVHLIVYKVEPPVCVCPQGRPSKVDIPTFLPAQLRKVVCLPLRVMHSGCDQKGPWPSATATATATTPVKVSGKVVALAAAECGADA